MTRPTGRKQGRERSCYTTYNGYRNLLYYHMKRRAGREPYYYDVRLEISKEEFIAFADSSPLRELHKVYVDSGFKKGLAPTVDRLDTAKHYALGNIEIVPLSENIRRKNLFYGAKRTHKRCHVCKNTKPLAEMVPKKPKPGQQSAHHCICKLCIGPYQQMKYQEYKARKQRGQHDQG